MPCSVPLHLTWSRKEKIKAVLFRPEEISQFCHIRSHTDFVFTSSTAHSIKSLFLSKPTSIPLAYDQREDELWRLWFSQCRSEN